MKISKEAIKSGIGRSVSGVFTLGGIGGIGYGSWLIYEPMAFILVGALVFWMGLPDR